MGRANVYLPDDLERRVRAARVPISEVCQRALLAAVEAAEQAPSRLEANVADRLRQGRKAGRDWVATAPAGQVLGVLRTQRVDDIPGDELPDDFYALSRDEALGWEAGFVDAAVEAARAAFPDGLQDGSAVTEELGTTEVAEEPPGAAEQADETATTDAPGDAAFDGAASALLGDDSGCQIGVTPDGAPVGFDPHTALKLGKSPVFAILGGADHRARLALGLAQDAAARGSGVLLLDLSGELTARATGLGRNVRLISNQLALPQLDDLVKGAVGLGGLWGTLSNLSGSGLGRMFGQQGENLIEQGYVTVLNLAGENGLAGALSAAQGLARLAGAADFPRLLHVDLSSSMTVPDGLASRVGKIVRVAREQRATIGLSAEGAQTLAGLAGSGAMLSTIFAFATSSPTEAGRLRDLLGAAAPVLLNAPGSAGVRHEESWTVMRDHLGRLGQVRIDVS